MGRRTRWGRTIRALGVGCLLAAAASAAWAQVRGTIAGTVGDRDGAPVRDLTIRFVLQGGDVVQTAKTNKKGSFLARGLTSGRYHITLDDARMYIVSAEFSAKNADGIAMGSGRAEGHPVRGLDPIPFSENYETRVVLVVTERSVAEVRQRSLAFALPALNAAADLYRKGEAERVVEETDKILAGNPDLGEAHYLRGLGLERLGRFDEATRALDTAVQQIPDYTGIWGVLGEVRMELGQQLQDGGDLDGARPVFAASAEAYREALRRDPDSQVYLANLAAALDRAGDEQALLPALELLLERDPQDLPTRLRLAALQSERGNNEAAMELLRGVPDTEKRAAVTLFNIAVRMNEAGNIDGSLMAATRATEIDPDLPHPYRLLAQIQLGKGNTTAAVAAIRKFLELAPDDPEAGAYSQILENLTQQ